MFRVPLLVAISLIIAFGGGIFATLTALEATTGFGAIRIGAWEATPEAQTADADPYAKAHRAKAGKLLYGTAEGLLFTASVDDTGARLSGNCDYRLSGMTPPARLWTVFAADQQGRPVGLPPELPSALNSWTVLRQQNGSFDIAISSEAQPGNWLAVPARGNFRLTLTLLDTPTAGSSGLIDLSMPSIVRTGCKNA